MKLIMSSEPTRAYGGTFTGEVSLAMLREAPDASTPDVARVSFRDGAVACWHAHPGA